MFLKFWKLHPKLGWFCKLWFFTLMVSKHFLRSSNHCRSNPPFTAGFWSGTTKLAVMGYTSVPVILINRQWSDISLSVCNKSRQCLVEPTLPVLYMNRQCSLDKHYRFLAQADSVLLTNSASLWLKPAMFSWPTLPLFCSSRQCSLDQHHRDISSGICWKTITVYVATIYRYIYFVKNNPHIHRVPYIDTYTSSYM